VDYFWDLRFSHQCCWSCQTPGMWCCVAWKVVPVIFKDHSAFIFRVKESNWTALAWKLISYDPSKCWKLLAQWPCITSHKICTSTPNNWQKFTLQTCLYLQLRSHVEMLMLYGNLHHIQLSVSFWCSDLWSGKVHNWPQSQSQNT